MEAKLSRSDKIYQWHLSHPKWSNAAIGKMFHCAREWVRVVIAREHLKYGTIDTRPKPKAKTKTYE